MYPCHTNYKYRAAEQSSETQSDLCRIREWVRQGTPDDSMVYVWLERKADFSKRKLCVCGVWDFSPPR